MDWELEVDLLVVGAGGAGLTAAAVGASEGMAVLVVEKTELVGGTTATSGGTVWVPLTKEGLAVAPADSFERVAEYLAAETGCAALDEVATAFVKTSAEAIAFLHERTEVRFKASNPYPDYHPDAQGGALAGRALQPVPFDGARLGADFSILRPPVPEFMVLGGMMVARDEIKHLIRPWRSWTSFRIASNRLAQYLRDRLGGTRGKHLVLGNALVGRLLYTCRQRGVDFALRTSLVDLVASGGRVDGAVLDGPKGRLRVRARRGVILSGGGCAASQKWRDELMGPGRVPHALAFSGNTGDTLDAAVRVGGEVDRNSHHSPFFWMPASIMRYPNGRVATYPHIRDRPKPGLIAVNRSGRRFVNESASYHDFVMAMHEALQPGEPAYLVCDRAFVHDFGVGVIHPVWQWLPRFRKAGYLVSAPTIEALAAEIRVDAASLRDSVDQHNRACETGVDTTFGKGGNAFNRNNGDPDTRPNPCLRPIAKSPFFAVAVHPAPIGSSVGLKTGPDGEVLNASGAPIDGLYAIGNDMNSVMRGNYPGPGITLGPALVFGYRAARHARRGANRLPAGTD